MAVGPPLIATRPLPDALRLVVRGHRVFGRAVPDAVVGDVLELRARVDLLILHVAVEPLDDLALDVAGRTRVERVARAVAGAVPRHLERLARVQALHRRVVVLRLRGREQRVDRALDDERGRGDVAEEIVGPAVGEEVLRLLGPRAGAGALDERLVDRRVVAAGLRVCRVAGEATCHGCLPGAVEQRAPAGLHDRLRVERLEQVVPGDLGRDRVHAVVARVGHPLDAARVGAAAHADHAGRPSSWRRGGRLAGRRSARRRRGPRSRAQSISTVPPDSPKPRESQVRTP